MPSRFSEPSTAWRMRSGRLSTPRLLAGLEVEIEAEFGGDDHLIAHGAERSPSSSSFSNGP